MRTINQKALSEAAEILAHAIGPMNQKQGDFVENYSDTWVLASLYVSEMLSAVVRAVYRLEPDILSPDS